MDSCPSAVSRILRRNNLVFPCRKTVVGHSRCRCTCNRGNSFRIFQKLTCCVHKTHRRCVGSSGAAHLYHHIHRSCHRKLHGTAARLCYFYCTHAGTLFPTFSHCSYYLKVSVRANGISLSYRFLIFRCCQVCRRKCIGHTLSRIVTGLTLDPIRQNCDFIG